MKNVKKIIVGISGGPDSMFLVFLLTNLLGKENLIIAHYNHKFRKESDYEEKKLREIFSSYNFVSESYDGTDFSEANLRKHRYDFFKKLGRGKYYLALGHNLTDRIETSFLSLARGGGLKGFLNMKKIDKSRKIIRPLLDIPKNEITQKCDLLGIPYFIDKTNFDEKISKRNLIRNSILPLFEKINYQFYYSFRKLYNQIESILPNFEIPNYLFKLDEGFYLVNYPSENLEYFIRELLEYFGELNFRGSFIKEIKDYFLNASGGGYKKIGKLTFLKKKGKIFLGVGPNLNDFKFLTKKYS